MEDDGVRPRRGDWRSAVRLVVFVLVAAACGLAGGASFAFGTCHDAGGFCSARFSSTNVEAYAGGVLLLTMAAVLLTAAVTRRPVVLAVAGLAVASLLVTVAAGLELANRGT